jgi:hypothetical protein
MNNLSSSSDRQFNFAMSTAKTRKSNEVLAIELILEDVHPSHLGMLPPDRNLLLRIAVNKGLLDYSPRYFH